MGSLILGVFFAAANFFNPYPSHLAPPEQQLEFTVYLPAVAQDHDPAWSWGGTELLTLSPAPNNEPFMVVDRSGRTHIFWDVWPSSDAFIYHMAQTDTGWSAPEKIANTLGSSRLETQPVITPDGVIHVLWYNELGFGSPYRLMYASYNAGQWSVEEGVARFSNPNRYGFMNYDGQGHIHLVFQDDDIFRTLYNHRERDAAGWTAPVDITPEPSNPIVTWNVSIDGAGGVVFVGWDYGHKLFYSYWRDGKFEKSFQPLAYAKWSESSIVDGQNNFHFYRTGDVPIPGGNVTGLYHQCLNAALEWGPEQVLSQQAAIGNSVSTASDDSGRVVFGWKLYRDRSIILAVMDGCTQPTLKTYQLPEPEQFSAWGDIEAIALTNQPGKFCALIAVPFRSEQFGMACADIH